VNVPFGGGLAISCIPESFLGSTDVCDQGGRRRKAMSHTLDDVSVRGVVVIPLDVKDIFLDDASALDSLWNIDGRAPAESDLRGTDARLCGHGARVDPWRLRDMGRVHGHGR
jgi:hypothetical protein